MPWRPSSSSARVSIRTHDHVVTIDRTAAPVSDTTSAPANILPTDFRLPSPAYAAQRATLAVKPLVSGLVRDSGHSLKVATRVRIPLGLRKKECW
jgi:hypothetical protein